MASSVGAGRTRTALWAIAGVVLLVGLIDSGSCMIARIQVDEDTKTSARYAVQQISGLPVNQQTATVAYEAATKGLPNKEETVVGNVAGTKEDFTVHRDSSITMTVTREAPTLVFKYIPQLDKFTTAKFTYTQAPLGM